MDSLDDLFPSHPSIWHRVRWKFRTIYDFFRHDLHQGIWGLYRWAKFAWQYRTWDYAYTLQAMEMCLTDLERTIRNHGHHTNSRRDAKEIRVALHYLRRFKEEDDTVFPKVTPGLSERGWAHLNRDNWDFLWKHLGKNIGKWWD